MLVLYAPQLRAQPAQPAAGLVVELVPQGSAAAKAGIQPGDVLLSYDGKSLTSPFSLLAAEDSAAGKSEVALQIRRNNELLILLPAGGRQGVQTRPQLPSDMLAFYEEGKAAQTARNPGTAIERWTTAAKAAQQARMDGAAAWLYSRAGEIHEGQRQWKEAASLYAAALSFLKETSDRSALSSVLSALGRCSQTSGDFPAAMKWFEEAESVDSAAGNEMWVAGALTNRGNVARSLNDLPHAEEYHQKALAIRERLAPNTTEVATSLNNLGIVAQARADLKAAGDYYSRSIAIKEKSAPDSLTLALSLHNFGEILRQRGDLAGAGGLTMRGLRIRERLAPDTLDLSGSLNSLGIIASMRGEYTEAEDYTKRSLAIRERLSPDSLLVAATLSNLGIVQWYRGELSAALNSHNRALTIQERLAPDSIALAGTLTNLGIVAKEQGDVAAALTYYRRSLAIRERLAPNSLAVAASLNNLGSLARQQKDYSAAHDYLVRALAIKERLAPNSLDVASTLTNLGTVAYSRRVLDEAEDYLTRSLQIQHRLAPNSTETANTLIDLGQVAEARGNTKSAQEFYQRSFDIWDSVAPNSLDMTGILNVLGNLALDEQRVADALPLFTRSVDIVESQRQQVRSTESRALLLAQHAGSYSGLLQTQIALKDSAGALATAERARARSLLELLAEAGAELRQSADPELLAEERRLQRTLNSKADQQTRLLSGQHTKEQADAARKELDALLVEYKEVQGRIRIKSPRYAALTQPQPLGLKEIQQQLDAQSLLLEYALSDEKSYLFAVTPTSIKSFELPGREAIDKAARLVYELLQSRQARRGETQKERQSRLAAADAAYPAAAAALSRMVLGPVASELTGQRLLIVADGALQYVPFGALPAPRNSTASAASAPLVVEHEIVSLPSVSVLAVLRREAAGRRPAERSVAVVADPVFDSEDPRLKLAAAQQPTPVARPPWLIGDRGTLSRLPFTREEADAIVALAPSASTKAIDFRASRATVMGSELSRYRIIHLATHGFLNTEHPELSGIVLSLVDENGKSQDGFLRLHEVYNLNWPAELVVLSACQTALGKEIKGEGLVGLTRGFMYAGAKRVMASLWNINDGATAEFMRRFYQNLLVKKLSPATALRATQIEMWKRSTTRSPFYWAAFVLQGEWRND